MRERYPGMLAGKGETPRSARLPQRTAAAVAVLEEAQQRIALAVRAVASGKKGPQQVLLRHTARAAGAMEVLRQA